MCRFAGLSKAGARKHTHNAEMQAVSGGFGRDVKSGKKDLYQQISQSRYVSRRKSRGCLRFPGTAHSGRQCRPHKAFICFPPRKSAGVVNLPKCLLQGLYLPETAVQKGKITALRQALRRQGKEMDDVRE